MTTRRFAARGKERDGSAEFGSNLSRRLQSDGAPLLGPEHRQVFARQVEPQRPPAPSASSYENAERPAPDRIHNRPGHIAHLMRVV